MERVWGGRKLETKLGKALPAAVPVGESWELVDREDAQSVVNHGDYVGTTLHELWTKHREAVFGAGLPDSPRFPLLAKILDARDKLSVQVHPPERLAAQLGGEPKTEMWYVLDADPNAELFAGFRPGTTRQEFERALAEGHAADLLHRLPAKRDSAIFIPSGRCHAIGAGCMMVEIQQNSDTTYRVFDWNRLGLDGKPRAMHIPESLASIDFDDIDPTFTPRDGELVVSCPYFRVEHWTLDAPRVDESDRGTLFTVLAGALTCGARSFKAGEFFLLPAAAQDRVLSPTQSGTTVLRTSIPTGHSA